MGVFARPFVVPETVRLDLEDGHWIEIKRELSYGDMQKVASLSRADLTASALHLVGAYLVDWSLQDAKGQGVPIDTDAQKIDALRALSNEAFNAIDVVIETHAKEARAAKKAKDRSGRRKSEAPSG